MCVKKRVPCSLVFVDFNFVQLLRDAVVPSKLIEANHTVSLGNDSGYIWNAFTTNATWAQVSDRRLKKNIEEDDLGLAFINALKPVTYNWKANEEIDPEFYESKVHKGEKKDNNLTNYFIHIII